VNLRQKILREIRERGPIAFSRYMEVCLYDPEYGYYSRNAEQFGKAGDFYTSSDVHAVFGRLLARQFDEMWRVLEAPTQIEVLELGPGRGLFAQDVLDWSENKFPHFFQALHYSLLERSAALRERIGETLQRHVQSGKAKLVEDGAGVADRSRDSATPEDVSVPLPRGLPADVPLIVFANEFFDALPVEVLSEKGSLRVAVRESDFVEEWAPGSSGELEFLDRYGIHPNVGERTEVCFSAIDWTKRIAAGMKRGFLIAIDYGYTREEQLAGRHLDTLMSYREHSASPNPYQAPGEQDITAHVNFTAIAAAAESGAMQTSKLRTQSQFLLGVGEKNQFADAFEGCRVPQEKAKVALQLKHLITPMGMGETFHVLVAGKGVELEVLDCLSGLSFGK
jgi:SAM-dependent MidA family methyltransferase